MDNKIEIVSVPAALLYPRDAHLFTEDKTVEVYLDGSTGWVHVVPVHRTEITSEEVDIARKYQLTLDYMKHNTGTTAVADGWL